MEITSLNSKLIQKCLLHAKQVAHSLLGVFDGIRKVIQNRIRTKEDCSGQENKMIETMISQTESGERFLF